MQAIRNIFRPAPPDPEPFYGFRWQYNTPPPNIIQGFNGDSPSGIYIGFQPRQLQPDTPFFTAGGDMLLYNPPPASSASLNQVAEALVAIDMQRPNRMGLYIMQPFLCELQGFLAYTARCLNYVYETGTGQQLINAINNGAHPVFVIPSGGGGNSAQPASGDNARCRIANEIFRDLNNLDRQYILDQIATYLPGDNLLAKLDGLANSMNALPLYSQFVDEADYVANFLGTSLQFDNAPINRTRLRDWLLRLGNGPAFENALVNMPLVDEVSLVDYFRIAILLPLYATSEPGAGTSTTISFRVRIDPGDQQDENLLRPPAVGLAHELMHALYNSRGTQPGHHLSHPTTMLFELLAVGLGPFQNEAISENTIRMQWGNVQNPDQSNQWAQPVRRTIYDEPIPPQTVADMRRVARTI
ncbi:MAG TPA: M91 family zinc metallopeptidase [Chloroflexia bacterium]|nr:M91 family zinc metallopeptidase [Chloroflexia bacterium]